MGRRKYRYGTTAPPQNPQSFMLSFVNKDLLLRRRIFCIAQIKRRCLLEFQQSDRVALNKDICAKTKEPSLPQIFIHSCEENWIHVFPKGIGSE